jgi:LuxR family maltose regulon positive regulatory protein
MGRKDATLAKISSPIIGESRILPRKRLFRLLHEGLKKPFIWIAGPPGSGKTTLVASYLTRLKLPHLWYQMDKGDEELATFFYCLSMAAKKAAAVKRKSLPVLTPEYQDAAAFARRYFEQLYAGPRMDPFVIVFDNHQEVPADSPFHRTIYEGLIKIPKGIHVVFISHTEPHPLFARLHAHNLMEVIEWETLRLTIEETRGIVKHQWKKPSKEDIEYLHNKTGGWVAGLKILLEQEKAGDRMSPDRAALNPKTIFDYFAEEIFGKMDDEARELLLKTSFLPQVNIQIARRLTGIEKAGKILEDLNRRNYFTSRYASPRTSYQFHPLFKEYLRSVADSRYSQDEINHLQRAAAALLQDAGQSEDAIELFRKAGDWGEVASLVGSYAPALFAQGRHQTIRQWLDSMPPAAVEQSPYLLYWRGVCQMTFDSLSGRKDFEHAFALFREQEDQLGLCLSWEGVVNTYIYSMDDLKPLDYWIQAFEELMVRYPRFPSQDVEIRVTSAMFYALLWRRPYHAAIAKWAERMEQLLEKTPDVNHRIMMGSYLSIYYIFIGSYSKLTFLQNLLRPLSRSSGITPMAEILWHSFEAVYHWLKVSPVEALAAATYGIYKANSTGVHLVDFSLYTHGAYAALLSDNFVSADEYLEKLAAIANNNRRLELGYYYYARGFAALLQNDFSAALVHVEKALRLTLEVGSPAPEAMCRIALAQVHLEFKDYGKAKAELARARLIAGYMQSRWFEYLCLLGEAQSAMDRKDEVGCAAFLGDALALGRAEGFVNHEWRRPAVMTGLCLKALEDGIEVEYVQDFIRRRRLVPESPPLHLENWPWALKIHTLGRFGLLRDGNPMRFQGKIQKKPMELLKVLIAFRGREVSEEKIVDALWPEALGDAARSAFSTTLQRLRQLIGNENALLLKDGRLSLNPRHCWVDIWLFEHILCEGEDALKHGRPAEAVRLFDEAITLYHGDFLAGETEYPWTISPRERLRGKFIRMVGRLGKYWEEQGECDKAEEYYQKGLEVDSLAEEFYQRLMICYQKQGRKAEALAVYHRCRETLAAIFGVAPSPQTEEIYRDLTQKTV